MLKQCCGILGGYGPTIMQNCHQHFTEGTEHIEHMWWFQYSTPVRH